MMVVEGSGFEKEDVAVALAVFGEGFGARVNTICIAIESDGDVFVAADAGFDGFGIFFAIEERFPGIDVLGFVEIAVGEKGEAFEADGGKDIVAIGNFPSVNNRRKDFLVFPEVKRVLAPFAFHDVGM